MANMNTVKQRMKEYFKRQKEKEANTNYGAVSLMDRFFPRLAKLMKGK